MCFEVEDDYFIKIDFNHKKLSIIIKWVYRVPL